ncbi:MAG: 2'-deoxycytidine 5'-triphosphate deaminase [Mycobacteriales bacterium]
MDARSATRSGSVGLGPELSGVLPDRLLQEAIAAGYVGAGEFLIQPHRVQPASIDLTLGDTAHRLRSSFLPDKDTVETKLEALSQGVVNLYGGGFLEVKVPYLIPLREELSLPPWLRAKANPKSSTGRIDVFTRVITDHNHQFDEVRPGYSGGLYLEVVPLSFPIKVRAGISLSQLRLIAGSSDRLSDAEIVEVHATTPLLYDADTDAASLRPEVGNGLFLSVDLSGDGEGIAGYRARSHTRLLDLTSDVPIDPLDFWEPVRSEPGGRILLEPETFYLLLSKERVSIPPHLASEMVAYDPTSGELRTHYAGFFDPGFGASPTAPRGSRAALEVRAHDVPFMVENGQSVCKLSFERMAEISSHLYGDHRSHYQGQESTLSKYFRSDDSTPPG